MKSIVILSVFLIATATAFVVREVQHDHFEDWQWVPNEKGQWQLFSPEEIEMHSKLTPRSEPIVKFELFTRFNQDAGHPLVVNDPWSIESSNFNADHPTRIIIHGWKNNRTSMVNRLLTWKYLAKGEFNVIVVDWGSITSSDNYFYVKDHVELIAPKVAEFIEFLHSYTKFSFENLYIIGHSLGAHVAGLAAKANKAGRVNTIIGLDPALPLFLANRPERRLNATDADYVEVIHSDTGVLGYDVPIGVADFYPNWGRSQPGCGWDLLHKCAHRRSIEFFAESIERQDVFKGVKCGSYDEIKNHTCVPGTEVETLGGEPVRRKNPGIYYLETANASPYGLGRPPKISS